MHNIAFSLPQKRSAEFDLRDHCMIHYSMIVIKDSRMSKDLLWILSENSSHSVHCSPQHSCSDRTSEWQRFQCHFDHYSQQRLTELQYPACRLDIILGLFRTVSTQRTIVWGLFRQQQTGQQSGLKVKSSDIHRFNMIGLCQNCLFQSDEKQLNSWSKGWQDNQMAEKSSAPRQD